MSLAQKCLAGPLIAWIMGSMLAAPPQAALAEAPFELPQIRVVSESEKGGRKVVRYEHDSMREWGYGAQQKDWFNLVLPNKAAKEATLCVVLHSAGGNGDEALAAICQPHDRQFYGDETYYVLCLDCATHKNDWWWGKEEIVRQPDLYRAVLCPTERRVLSTVEWVITTFGIDRNRVYLNGISMGGSGSLGIGMAHGDVFAAVSVVVPAGVEHMELRSANRKIPEPPPLFNISSPVDSWARGQERLLSFCEENRYFLSFAWGPFGHTAQVNSANPAVYEYPWLSIKRNQAYPVFTHATTDDPYPGFMNSTAPRQDGQINGYFRWTPVEDTANRFVIDLKLIDKEELRRPVETPRKAVADVTLRRLQRFVVGQGARYTWSTTRADKVLQSGKAAADAKGMLTVPAVEITVAPARLLIVPEP